MECIDVWLKIHGSYPICRDSRALKIEAWVRLLVFLVHSCFSCWILLKRYNECHFLICVYTCTSVYYGVKIVVLIIRRVTDNFIICLSEYPSRVHIGMGSFCPVCSFHNTLSKTFLRSTTPSWRTGPKRRAWPLWVFLHYDSCFFVSI